VPCKGTQSQQQDRVCNLGELTLPKTNGTELGESFDTGGGDVGLGGAETRMAAVGPTLSSGESLCEQQF